MGSHGGRLRQTRRMAMAGLLAAASLASAQLAGEAPTRSLPSASSSPSSLSSRPSAFLPELSETSAAKPANTSASQTRANSSAHEQGWIRRIVTDWLHRGNKTEPVGNFFRRLRQEERLASDSLLVSRCRSLLVSDAAVRASFIHISSQEGVLTLRGEVPTDSIRQQAEQLARNTVGIAGVKNELTVGNHPLIERASYASASLALPERMDGSSLRLPASLPTSGGSLSPDVATISPTPSLSASLGSTIEPIVPMIASLPAVKHRTVEQQVAKPVAAPTVLPSGQRVWSGIERKPTIPAPPAEGSKSIPGPSTPGPSAESPIASADRLEAQKTADVAALLAKDPRARSLTFSLRGNEVRLAGSVMMPSDLFALSDLIDALPGIDFVSFDEVSFQTP